MRRTKGFTLIELMVVVSIIALLAMMLVPALQRAVGMANKAACAGNLNSAFKGITLYQQNNDQQFPMLPGAGWDTVLDGKNYIATGATGATPPYKTDGSPDWTSERSVTAIMFMLVRDGQGVRLFNCQADAGASPDPIPQTSVTPTGSTTAVMTYNWDFSCGATAGQASLGSNQFKRMVSYSFQCPTYSSSGSTVTYAGIVSPDPGLVIMADRTPIPKDASSGAPSEKASYKGTGKGPIAWANTLSATTDLKYFNSQNHFDGEVQNVLYAGGNVASFKTPLAGLIVSASGKNDLIYTAGTESATDEGSTLATSGADETKHVGKGDTYLWGGASPK